MIILFQLASMYPDATCVWIHRDDLKENYSRLHLYRSGSHLSQVVCKAYAIDLYSRHTGTTQQR